jgi:hypothetical protein
MNQVPRRTAGTDGINGFPEGTKFENFTRTVHTISVNAAEKAEGQQPITTGAEGTGVTAAKDVFTKEQIDTYKANFHNSQFYTLSQLADAPVPQKVLDYAEREILAKPEALKKMDELGISLTQAVAICAYTVDTDKWGMTSPYAEVNKALRQSNGGALTGQLGQFVQEINNGLNRLPINCLLVSRNETVNSNEQWAITKNAQYSVSSKFVDPGFCPRPIPRWAPKRSTTLLII